MIKDSGERRSFDTGAVRDIQEGKGRCDLMPLEVVSSLVLNPCSRKGKSIKFIGEFQKSGDSGFLYAALWSFIGELQCDVHTVLLEVSKHFEEGAKKYGENNWQKGIPVNCYIDSAIRHYLKWLRGDKDEDHARAFVWNIMCCIWEVDFREK